MIPQRIEEHLLAHHAGFQYRPHRRAVAAQRLAAVEHVPGRRVAKPIVVRIGDRLAMAVVPATARANLAALEAATGAPCELVPEAEFARVFQGCEAGAEPPLAMFGLPIYVDAALSRESSLLMRCGTHEDAVEVSTADWMRCEGARPVEHLADSIQ
jgi:Ala-tRNA(Pro) deacylase